MARVVLESVSKVFAGDVFALRELNLEIEEQEYLVLLGPSGCGKSTTLRLIAGLERPSAGIIRIGDREVNNVAVRNRNIALVLQNQPLYPQLTVAGNLDFGLKQQRTGDWLASIWKRLVQSRQATESAAPRNGISVRVREAARKMGVEHLLDRWPRQLSGGERQRVALGRALVRNPAVFLLDEPLSSVDGSLRTELRDVLRRMHLATRAATVHVTHDQAEAMSLADRVAVMEQGKVRQVGRPLEVYDRPENMFVARFIGDPPMNLLPGRLICEGTSCRIEGGTAGCIQVEGGAEGAAMPQDGKVQFENREITWGVRPEHTEVGPPSTEVGRSDWQISRVEQLGDQDRVHVEPARQAPAENFANHKLIAKTIHRINSRPGAVVSVKCQARHLHCFDPRSGERLS